MEKICSSTIIKKSQSNYQKEISNHYKKVEILKDLIIKYNHNKKEGDYFSLKKSTISHFAPQSNTPRQNSKKINITDFTDIIHIDTHNKVCIAESSVPFNKLVKETLKYNLIPMCVPELETITIGGAVAGCSLESMSFKYGGFFDSCINIEIITGKGEIINSSKEKNKDIFEMIHGSYGTLGILTLLKFKLIPAKPYVKIEYECFSSFNNLMAAIMKHYQDKDLDFIDAITHAPDKNILCKGTMVDKAPFTNKYNWINAFYKSTLSKKYDFLNLYDYFYRYNADCHWISHKFGFHNKLLRFLFGKFILGSTNMIKWTKVFPGFTKTKGKPDVTVDVFIPYSKMMDFWNWYIKTYDYYPLWIVPYHINKKYPWISKNIANKNNDSLFIDCAIYGMQQLKNINYYKLMEEKVAELGGIKTLISYNYYTEKEFWESFNQREFKNIKQKTDPNNIFQNVYNKLNYTEELLN
jgi:FAD/FMN-containing dehydrogenase